MITSSAGGCSAPKAPANAATPSCPSGRAYGASCTFGCLPGYTGGGKLTCILSGSWVGSGSCELVPIVRYTIGFTAVKAVNADNSATTAYLARGAPVTVVQLLSDWAKLQSPSGWVRRSGLGTSAPGPKTYNREGAVQYARQHCSRYNPSFHNFNPEGGDCANFASQVLAVGGELPQTPSWYSTACSPAMSCVGDRYEGRVYDKPHNWMLANGLRDYIRARYGRKCGVEDVQRGDLVSMTDRQHVMVVVGKTISGGKYTLQISAHNSDRCGVTYTDFSGLEFTCISNAIS